MDAQGVSSMLARLELAMRSERRMLFGPAVSSPDGWDIILVLYIADAEGRRLTAREALAEVGGPDGSGRRRISALSERGVVVGDGAGRLDDVVTLAPEAVTRVEEIIDRIRGSIVTD